MLMCTVVFCAGFLLLPYNYFTGIDFDRVSGIEDGMTMDECRKMAGEPHYLPKNWREDVLETWGYSVRGAGDMFTIDFDENGQVVWASF